MNWAALVARLLPGALALAYQAVVAIVNGDHQKAARLAEEAARRQAVRLAVDAGLAAKRKLKL
jgi:hypothetical protein